jgi:hypothetical protein
LVLWDSKSYENVSRINKKESYNIPQIDLSRQATKMTLNREPTRATSKSSGSTRSGTLSSRKSSGKTNPDEEDINEKPLPFNEQQQQQQQTNCKSFIHWKNRYQYESFFFIVRINDDQSDYSSAMNKRALKLCEPQQKSITVLITTGE